MGKIQIGSVVTITIPAGVASNSQPVVVNGCHVWNIEDALPATADNPHPVKEIQAEAPLRIVRRCLTFLGHNWREDPVFTGLRDDSRGWVVVIDSSDPNDEHRGALYVPSNWCQVTSDPE